MRATESSSTRRSPMRQGLRNSHCVLTIGKPKRRSMCMASKGKPSARANQSSTAALIMSKKRGKCTIPPGSQCEKRIRYSLGKLFSLARTGAGNRDSPPPPATWAASFVRRVPGIGTARSVVSDTSAIRCRARRRSSPATFPETRNSTALRPRRVSTISSASTSPTRLGLKKSHCVLTVGNPMPSRRRRVSRFASIAASNQSSMASYTISK